MEEVNRTLVMSATEPAVESRFANFTHLARQGAALGASTLVLAFGAEAATTTAYAEQMPVTSGRTPAAETVAPDMSSEHVFQCEQAALFSFNGARSEVVRRNGSSNKFIRQVVTAQAMPEDCNGVVARAAKVAELKGRNPKHLELGTKLTTVDTSNNAFNKRVIQKYNTPYKCGEYVKQFVRFEVAPVGGGKTYSKNFVSKKPARSC